MIRTVAKLVIILGLVAVVVRLFLPEPYEDPIDPPNVSIFTPTEIP